MLAGTDAGSAAAHLVADRARRTRCHPRRRDRLAHGRGTDPSLHVRRHPPALEAGRERARRARRRAGRSHRARWPGTATGTGALFRRVRAWARCCTRSIRGSSRSRSTTSSNHAEDQIPVLRPHVRAAGREARAAAASRSKGFVAMTDRAHMPALDVREPALLRGLVGAQDSDYDGRVRRAHRVVALLHVGDDRQSEGRAVLASLDGAAFVRRRARSTASAARRQSRCCSSCRCSTSMRGACRMPARCPARSSCCRARRSTARASTS